MALCYNISRGDFIKIKNVANAQENGEIFSFNITAHIHIIKCSTVIGTKDMRYVQDLQLMRAIFYLR